MSACTERPWTAYRPAGGPTDIVVDHGRALGKLRDAVRWAPDRPLPRDGDATSAVRRVDEPTGAPALAPRRRRSAADDRRAAHPQRC